MSTAGTVSGKPIARRSSRTSCAAFSALQPPCSVTHIAKWATSFSDRPHSEARRCSRSCSRLAARSAKSFGASTNAAGAPVRIASAPAIIRYSGSLLTALSLSRRSKSGFAPANGGQGIGRMPAICPARRIASASKARRSSTPLRLCSGTGSGGSANSSGPGSERLAGRIRSAHQPRSRSAYRSSNSTRSLVSPDCASGRARISSQARRLRASAAA